MSTHYTFCEKCDLKILVGKNALAKGVVCPECGDRFSPTKLNRVNKVGRELSGLAGIAIMLGIAFAVVSFFVPELTIAADAFLWIGLISFVLAQLLHIRAAVEKLSGK
jgi:predicted Kef-type K+ transport protein